MGRRLMRGAVLAAVTLAGACHVPETGPTPPPTYSTHITRVSLSSENAQVTGSSTEPRISADGRYVAFTSGARSLVPGDTNGTPDVFVRDRQTGTTTRVSVAADGTQGNRLSSVSGISPDGRFVIFASRATNLVPGDTNKAADLFIHDRDTGVVTRIALAPDALPAANPSIIPLPPPETSLGSYAAMSADDRYLMFTSTSSALVADDTNNASDVFVLDRTLGTMTRVSVADDGSQADGASWAADSISADGRRVVFGSSAANLVSGDTNGRNDTFVRDLDAGTTLRVSVASDGSQANGASGSGQISADGHSVVFSSDATNLVPDDTNGYGDAFVRDLDTGTTTRVSVASDGTQANAPAGGSSISGDGRFVTLLSSASNLAPTDPILAPYDASDTTDVYLRDRLTNQTIRISAISGPTWESSTGARISADGRYVTFSSNAPFLVPHDTNGTDDVYVYDLSS